MRNISGGERVIRIILGAAIIGWGVYAKSWWGLVGLLLLLTGVIGWCGLYQLKGICCPFSRKKDNPGGSKGGCCCGHK